MMNTPESCDVFAVLPPHTDRSVIFGKNSDRPLKEVQEVVYVPRIEHPANSKLKCTYIEIDQVPTTYAVILNKPAWMWGAEMGANEHDVVIGNVALFTKLKCDDDMSEKLLGADLLRLGLERAKTADEAVTVVTQLLKKHGMGGSCIEHEDLAYHTGFIIADPKEVWNLELAGSLWAARRQRTGVLNKSNALTVQTTIHRSSEGMVEYAKRRKLYKEGEEFNFTKVFDPQEGRRPVLRYIVGKRLLDVATDDTVFTPQHMFAILRNVDGEICVTGNSGIITHGSQVSVLKKKDCGMLSVHFFTATTNPSQSFYKPFFFATHIVFPDVVISMKTADKRQALEKLRSESVRNANREENAVKTRRLEQKYLKLAYKIASNEDEEGNANRLFNDAVSEELALYQTEFSNP